jgi:hypothetical protein
MSPDTIATFICGGWRFRPSLVAQRHVEADELAGLALGGAGRPPPRHPRPITSAQPPVPINRAYPTFAPLVDVIGPDRQPQGFLSVGFRRLGAGTPPVLPDGRRLRPDVSERPVVSHARPARGSGAGRPGPSRRGPARTTARGVVAAPTAPAPGERGRETIIGAAVCSASFGEHWCRPLLHQLLLASHYDTTISPSPSPLSSH